MAFIRKAQLVVGKPGDPGIEIDKLRITFDIKKTTENTANEATISLFNIGQTTRNLVREEGSQVILRAGYENGDGLQSLFFGGITRVEEKRGGTDHETIIEAYDGRSSRNSVQVSLSYGAGSKASNIVNDIVSALGLSLGNRPQLNAEFNHGFSFAGLAKDALTRVLDAEGFTWSIQNEQLYITRPDEAPEVTAVVLSPNTGMIGRPEDISEDGVTKWRIQSLLFPQIIPRSIVEVESVDLSGQYRVEVAEFTGDTFGGDYMTTIEVVPA